MFELQAWLGHRSLTSIHPVLRENQPHHAHAGLHRRRVFSRNVRTIEVLVDRDAVTSGAAANDEPWQYYDLGHRYCTYTFFEQCPHKMACARCDLA